jgi:hypothetical protein
VKEKTLSLEKRYEVTGPYRRSGFSLLLHIGRPKAWIRITGSPMKGHLDGRGSTIAMTVVCLTAGPISTSVVEVPKMHLGRLHRRLNPNPNVAHSARNRYQNHRRWRTDFESTKRGQKNRLTAAAHAHAHARFPGRSPPIDRYPEMGCVP